ncbi:MAG: alkaline phosphatase [bacterium]|nr:alkaline phosphatase [bacterium]
MRVRSLLPLVLLTLVCDASLADAPRAKNVILMVADGAGFNTFKATSMYEGTLGGELYDGDGWVRLASATHALRATLEPAVSAEHANVQIPSLVYDPGKAWDTTRLPAETGEYPSYFAGYRWLRRTAPDSANTASAMSTGRVTYSGAINVDGAGAPVEETLARLARRDGRRVGVVSSVLFAHATPAAGSGVSNVNRRAYCPLAVSMLTAGWLDVVAGCGNPDFDHNGEALGDNATKNYRYVGGREVWDAVRGVAPLEAGLTVCGTVDEGGLTLTDEQVAAIDSWKLVQSKAKIEKLENGRTPEKLLLVPEVGEAAFWSGSSSDPLEPNTMRVGGTLQQQRGSRADPGFTDPGYDPPLDNVPSLAAMTRAAVNALDDDDDGLFLFVEGGAVDWAMHENQMGRMVEETMAFKEAIRAVVDWVDARDAWDTTLLIVTADHDHMLWGPGSDTTPFQPLEDRGAGNLPGYKWLSSSHSNALVPVYARGAGAESLLELASGDDPFYGPYVHQTDIYTVLRAAIETDP